MAAMPAAGPLPPAAAAPAPVAPPAAEGPRPPAAATAPVAAPPITPADLAAATPRSAAGAAAHRPDLYTRWFGASVFPLLDRVNGTRIAACLAELAAAERLDPEEIHRRQLRKVAAAVERAVRTSPFYLSFVESVPAGPRSRWPALDRLPVLTRSAIAAAGEELLAPAWRGRSLPSRTSGSTGRPMTFYRTVEQESWFWALRFRIWSWAGYRPGDPYLTINLNPRVQWKKRLQDRLFRCAYLTFNADNQDSARVVRELERRRIVHLNGFSSSLYVLARFMLDRGIANPGVIGITATGDTLYPVYREAIEAAFGGVRVLDYYGAGGEALHLASQCPESGGRYHLHPENALVEILDGHGPVPPGTPGRVVVTQLDNEAMPLVRYELGDVAVAAAPGERCPCGRTLPLLERVEGRLADLVATPDGAFLVPHFFVVLFKTLRQVHRYQVVQDRLEALRIRLVPVPDADREAIEAAVAQAVGAATRGTMRTEVEWVEEIPLSGAGKRRLVISRLAGDRLARQPAPISAGDPSLAEMEARVAAAASAGPPGTGAGGYAPPLAALSAAPPSADHGRAES
jgi:phenylacetate-CoA ligase